MKALSWGLRGFDPVQQGLRELGHGKIFGPQLSRELGKRRRVHLLG